MVILLLNPQHTHVVACALKLAVHKIMIGTEPWDIANTKNYLSIRLQ